MTREEQLPLFSLEPALFADRPLDHLLDHLRRQEMVDGILLVGTTASGWHEHGDYDLVLVVTDRPAHLFGITTFVNSVFSELLLYTLSEVQALRGSRQIQASDRMGWLAGWARAGRIVADRSGLLHQLQQESQVMQLAVDFTEKYNSWRKINYNLIQNQRYFRSGLPLYLEALDLRLLCSSIEVLTGYFTLRDRPWMGEKAAIHWLAENDPAFWELFRRYLQETERAAKFALYTGLAERALAPFGGLAQEGTMMMMYADFDESTVQEAVAYWELLSC